MFLNGKGIRLMSWWGLRHAFQLVHRTSTIFHKQAPVAICFTHTLIWILDTSLGTLWYGDFLHDSKCAVCLLKTIWYSHILSKTSCLS